MQSTVVQGLQGRKKAEAVFRETFGRLGELRTLLPEGTPILAMTATATKKSRRMIYHSLCLRSPEELVSSPDRKNVKLSIRKIPTVAIIDGEKVKLEPSEQFDHVFKPLVEDIVTKKRDEIKNDVLKSLIDDGHYRLIIATNALGMGINARHVRRVFNVGIPEDIEAYIQEIGRAGRDGQRSHVILFYKSFHLLQLMRR
ncbi:putative Werner syndrome ATP-dependent helicase-like [Apostichopus japonicus]|uniref:DNA 3'-5' helicase n=1 Tax=Stichopus japonicus TaxID=307972 RepID=A0A2G8L221_STIJA|nr:putative Werner syndrome ATP-dependent helicase-like [Apostichopus japonicus]